MPCPHHIFGAEFRSDPFILELIFRLVSFFYRIEIFGYSSFGRDWYPFVLVCYLETIASAPIGVPMVGSQSPVGFFKVWASLQIIFPL